MILRSYFVCKLVCANKYPQVHFSIPNFIAKPHSSNLRTALGGHLNKLLVLGASKNGRKGSDVHQEEMPKGNVAG
eukprot:m.165771 g.165771  ORF g.165771 m.165771 type:complete len:75 (+) comp53125_c0_seq1:737-961(+)